MRFAWICFGPASRGRSWTGADSDWLLPLNFLSMQDSGWKHVWPLLWEDHCYQRWHFGPALRFSPLKCPGKSYSCSPSPSLSPTCSTAWWAATTRCSSPCKRTTRTRGGWWRRRQLLWHWGRNFTPLPRAWPSSPRPRGPPRCPPCGAMPRPSRGRWSGLGPRRLRPNPRRRRRLLRPRITPPRWRGSTRNSAPRTANSGWTAPRITGRRNFPKPSSSGWRRGGRAPCWRRSGCTRTSEPWATSRTSLTGTTRRGWTGTSEFTVPLWSSYSRTTAAASVVRMLFLLVARFTTNRVHFTLLVEYFPKYALVFWMFFY